MKHSNTKTIVCLLIGFFSFNSFSLNTMSQLFADAKKAAQEDGRNIDFKTCDDNDGGFNPDHVHKVYEMGNDKKCDYGSKVVKSLSANVFLTFSKTTNRPYGSGILAADCKTFLSVAHIFRGEKSIPQSDEVGLYNPNNGQKLNVNRSSIKFDPLTDDAGSDKAVLQASGTYSCNSQIEISTKSVAEVKSQKGAKFYILKTNFKRTPTENKGSESSGFKTELKDGRMDTCSEECTLSDRQSSGASVPSTMDLFIHNCNTVAGNSGSPIVMETSDGKLSIVALHSGGSDITGKELHGTSSEDSRNKYSPNQRVNYAVPVRSFFKK